VIRQVVLAAAILAAASPAHAHKIRVQRVLHLEPAGAELHLLVHLKVPSGEAARAVWLLARGDRAEIERALVARALDGVVLAVGGATVAIARPEVKLRADRPGEPIELMLHGTVPLGSPRLALEQRTTADPLEVLLLPGTRPVCAATRGRWKPKERVHALTLLGPNDRVAWALAPEGAPARAPIRGEACR
jgi:hypothetical protein